MDVLALALAVVALAISLYTQLRIGNFVRGTTRAVLLRVFLLLLGIGIGSMAAAVKWHQHPALVFLMGFGLVHFPPAVVLMLKGLRGEGRS